MKRTLLAFAVMVLAISSSGCTHHNLARNGCNSCGCQSCGNGGYAGGGGCRNGMCGNGGCRDGQCGGLFGGGLFARGGNGGGGYAGGGQGGGAGGQAACRTCGRGMGGGHPGGICQYDPSGHYSDNGMPGPSAAQVAYPYYTLRGPRDFLLDNPPSIGR